MQKSVFFGIVIWSVFFCVACADPAKLEGKYQSSAGSELFVLMELKPSGQGTWETDMDMVSFRWKQRGQEIWLHTRTGGVIVGDIENSDHLRMEIPGIGLITFEKIS